MPRTLRELKGDLRQAGFSERPGKGSHTVWHHPLVPGRVVLSESDGDDAKRYQERMARDALEQLRRAREERHDGQ